MNKKAKKRCKAIIKRHTLSRYKRATMLLRFYQKQNSKLELYPKEQVNYFFLPCGDGKNGKEKLVEYIKEIKL